MENYDPMTDSLNPLDLCSIKLFNFADISKIFTSIIRVSYSDIKSKTIIVSTPFQVFVEKMLTSAKFKGI